LVVKGGEGVHLARVLALGAVVEQGEGWRGVLLFGVGVLEGQVRAGAAREAAVVHTGILTTISRHFVYYLYKIIKFFLLLLGPG